MDVIKKIKSQVFGVKREGSSFIIEATDVSKDNTKYDFLIQDGMMDLYYNNSSYVAEVLESSNQTAIFNNWKLKHISIPRNLNGQRCYFTLRDKLNRVCEVVVNVAGNYLENQEHILREALKKIRQFTTKYQSVEQYNADNGMNYLYY